MQWLTDLWPCVKRRRRLNHVVPHNYYLMNENKEELYTWNPSQKLTHNSSYIYAHHATHLVQAWHLADDTDHIK